MKLSRRFSVALTASVLTLGSAAAGVMLSPAGASTDPGVNTGTKTITIGATVPLTGLASLGFADVAKSAISVFNYVNKAGGINGWKVNFVAKDDCYNLGLCPGVPGTVTQTNALEALPVFATVGSLGTATQQSVKDQLKADGVPQLFVNSGANQWNDPHNYPTLFGFQTNYLAEGKIFANYITTSLKGKSVGFIGQNDDFGTDGLQGLKNGGVSPSGNLQQWYGSTDIVFNQGVFTTDLTALKNAGAQVVVLDTIPQATNLVLKAAKNIGFKGQFLISGVGSDPTTVNNATENGAVTFTFLPASSATTNPWNAWIAKVLAASSGTTSNGVSAETFKKGAKLNANQQYGAAWAVAFLEVLNKATLNNGVPTRSGFISALETTSFQTPGLVPLAFSPTNHQGFTGGILVTVLSSASTKDTKQIGTTVYNVDPSTQALTSSKLVSSTVPTYLH